LKFVVDLHVPESQHTIAALAKPLVSPNVVGLLIAMLISIDFDHDLFSEAGKVGKVGPDRNLATKFRTIQLAAAQPVPQPPF